MKRLREILALVSYNWKPLVGFALFYKLASVLVFVPLLWGMFDLVMKAGGYAYLTLENIGAFLTDWRTVPLLLLLFVLAASYAMVDISAVVFTLDQSAQKVKVRFGQILRFSVRNGLRAWNPKNLMLILVVLLLLPFLNIGMASSVLTTISIPEFIQDFIDSNGPLALLFLLLTIFLTVLMQKWLYAFHYFTLEGCSFGEARRKSKALGRKRRFRDFMTLFFVQFVFALLYLVFLFAAIALAAMVGKLFSGVFVLRWLASTFVWTVLVFSVILVAALSMPVSYGCISVLYYRRKEERGEAVVHSEAPQYVRKEKRERLFHRCFVAAGWLVAAGSLALGFFLCSGRLNPQIEFVRTMEITAHRGASAFYPENTMAAFRGAKELGADWIELDVQQSSDGQIMVIHDTNLLRTTGVDANTWEMTYEEIERLDAGSFFDETYAGEKIPLLSEAARFAKENQIRLNIELKPTGHETDFEQAVVDVVRQEGIADSCVITSQTYEVLERVKAYDDSITTVYVMSLAYGDINRLTAADHFSVEATNATDDLVSRVHRAGKQLYAWTVNTKEGIDRMIGRNVDNIITDDIELARECVYESRYSDLLGEYIKLFE